MYGIWCVDRLITGFWSSFHPVIKFTFNFLFLGDIFWEVCFVIESEKLMGYIVFFFSSCLPMFGCVFLAVWFTVSAPSSLTPHHMQTLGMTELKSVSPPETILHLPKKSSDTSVLLSDPRWSIKPQLFMPEHSSTHRGIHWTNSDFTYWILHRVCLGTGGKQAIEVIFSHCVCLEAALNKTSRKHDRVEMNVEAWGHRNSSGSEMTSGLFWFCLRRELLKPESQRQRRRSLKPFILYTKNTELKKILSCVTKSLTSTVSKVYKSFLLPHFCHLYSWFSRL